MEACSESSTVLEHHQHMNYDSCQLKEWYRKRGFAVDDPDTRHLWCYTS